MVLRIRTVALAPRSVTREHLEYPTEYVSFSYLAAINKIRYVATYIWGLGLLSYDVFADKAFLGFLQVNLHSTGVARLVDYANFYYAQYDPGVASADFQLAILVNGSFSILTQEAIDLDNKARGLMLSAAGSTLKAMRYELLGAMDPLSMPAPNATLTATNTTFSSGYFGGRFARNASPHGIIPTGGGWLMPPASPGPEAKVILEVEVEGDGSSRNPYRPALVKELVEITPDLNIPDFLKEEKKKYDILRAKGFTDEEMELLLGYKPQSHVDVASVSMGSFEFNHDSPTNVITIFDTNPYDPRAIERQVEMARAKNLRVYTVPEDIGLVLDIYRELSREHPEWLAGKDNFLYQATGLEIFDILQNVDFYYGELLELRKHYDQLKMVPEREIWARLTTLEEKLEKITELVGERDKHLAKLREIKKKGW